MPVNLCVPAARLRVGNAGSLCGSLFSGQASLALDPLNLDAQPMGQSLFHFDLTARTVQIVDRYSLLRKRNKAARYGFAALFLRHELRQQATVAGMRPRGIAKIWADGRIFKDGGRAPRRSWRPSIASVLQEAQLKPKNVQNVTPVLCHRSP